MVKPDAVHHLGQILDAILQAGVEVTQMRMCRLSAADAQQFYAVHAGRPFYERLVQFMSSGRVVALELQAPTAVARLPPLLQPIFACLKHFFIMSVQILLNFWRTPPGFNTHKFDYEQTLCEAGQALPLRRAALTAVRGVVQMAAIAGSHRL